MIFFPASPKLLIGSVLLLLIHLFELERTFLPNIDLQSMYILLVLVVSLGIKPSWPFVKTLFPSSTTNLRLYFTCLCWEFRFLRVRVRDYSWGGGVDLHWGGATKQIVGSKGLISVDRKTSLLSHVQYPVPYQSRLQRILDSICPFDHFFAVFGRSLLQLKTHRVTYRQLQYGFWLRGVQSLSYRW